ncbi:hypothetical protein AB1Y20_021123 [Prymnesium parvum]|uniref:non-specific serine/threonine protein kinase n=1 Tax=Prymnesium parvum TaxID=97485 RepID=A0AB34JL50_PRYPA
MHKYKRVRQIGKGAFGAAVLVCDVKRPKDQYVVKHVDVSRMKPDDREAAMKEVRLLASFQHPHIIQYRDSFVEGGTLHIVMDYAECGDVHGLLKARGGELLPEEQVLEYFVQLCLAMEHVHSKRVLHRDLKPQNLFLTNHKRTLKLGDFGIARTLASSMELAQTTCGTPYYMSPEICENKPYDAKSDVWSMGCLLYELASLKCPFDASNMMSLVKKIMRGWYPPLPAPCSAGLSNLVESCLNKRHTARPSAKELLAVPLLRPIVERYTAEMHPAPSEPSPSAKQEAPLLLSRASSGLPPPTSSPSPASPDARARLSPLPDKPSPPPAAPPPPLAAELKPEAKSPPPPPLASAAAGHEGAARPARPRRLPQLDQGRPRAPREAREARGGAPPTPPADGRRHTPPALPTQPPFERLGGDGGAALQRRQRALLDAREDLVRQRRVEEGRLRRLRA